MAGRGGQPHDLISGECACGGLVMLSLSYSPGISMLGQKPRNGLNHLYFTPTNMEVGGDTGTKGTTCRGIVRTAEPTWKRANSANVFSFIRNYNV